MAAPEDWTADGDFEQGPDRLFRNSLHSLSTALSSRLSIKSGESNVPEDNWEFVVQSNDESATQKAIRGAKQAGIPIPHNIPSSALMGGTIKKLGKSKSKQNLDADWGLDIDLPAENTSPLRLKAEFDKSANAKRKSGPSTPIHDADDFDLDWAEGSLGVRAGGTKRETRNRSSSASAMSPSLGSCMTVESEDDGIDGLVLPNDNVDFAKLLHKRKEAGHQDHVATIPPKASSNLRPASPAVDTVSQLIPTHEAEDENPLDGLDVDTNIIDLRKPTTNRNIKITSSRIQVAPVRSTTTLTFTDKSGSSKIPRPATTRNSRLDPVYEPGAVHITRTTGRPAPTTTSSQLLRAKRSAPVLRSQYQQLSSKPSVPFLPAGISSPHFQHTASKSSHTLGYRRDSNPERSQSPSQRPLSRLSRIDGILEGSPSRAGHRKDMASPALAREASTKRNIVRPARRRNFGDGTELDLFDDLPTSAQKENQFVKQPTRAGPPKPTLKSHVSLSRLASDRARTQTPFPPVTPTSFGPYVPSTNVRPSTPKGLYTIPFENTPRFARDTAASRNAREQRLGAPTSRDGPLKQVQTNWKAQVALRNPNLSPTATRTREKVESKKPQLIKWMGAESVRNEKGMTYNLAQNRWDGNENEVNAFYEFEYPLTPQSQQPRHTPTNSRHMHSNSTPSGLGLQGPNLVAFNHVSHDSSASVLHPTYPQLRRQEPSPPRRAPALISHVSSTNNVQVEKGMVLDPRLMKWLKITPGQRQGGASPSTLSIDDEDDPFAGIDDLPDENAKLLDSVASPKAVGSARASLSGSQIAPLSELMVGEEFDVGPAFIRKQREEEAIWRQVVDGWIGPWRTELGESWRWAIREQAFSFEAQRLP